MSNLWFLLIPAITVAGLGIYMRINDRRMLRMIETDVIETIVTFETANIDQEYIDLLDSSW